MTAGGPERCGVCDLPLAQCAHALERRLAKAERRRAAKAGRKPAGKQKRTASKPGGPEGNDPRCATCGTRARYGRYRLCLRCGIEAGFRVCGRCGRYFQPDAQASVMKKPTCKGCKKKGRRGSVWVTASAGSPGLGRRG